jgi:hypothetical protein
MTDERLQTSDLVQEDADRPIGRDEEADGDAPRDQGLEPLFDEGRTSDLRERWHALQARFVDDPQAAVGEADSLVAELLRDLAETFDKARGGLEEQWTRGDDVSTEELRVTLQRYRSFFERLLEV